MIALYILIMNWVYYGLATCDFLVMFSIYCSLARFLSIMSPFYDRIGLRSELDTVRNVMGVFGVTFIVGFALNIFKGIMMN